MEVKINKDIREYTESMFFGLTLRQFICVVLACAISVAAYIILRPIIGQELTSWVCILGALPCIVIGFVRYNGMYAEQLIRAIWISEVKMPRQLVFKGDNLYAELMEIDDADEYR